MRDRRALLVAAVAGVVLVVAAIIAGQSGDGGTLDPDGTGPGGLRAFVSLVEAVGGEVEESIAPASDTSVVALFRDDLGPAQRAEVREWVERGGVLVVTDPASSFAGDLTTPRLELEGLRRGRGNCAVTAMDAIDTIETGGTRRFEVRAGDRGCFGDDASAWMVVADAGLGAVVSLGDPGPFVNAGLSDADNAGLALALFAPGDDASVVIVEAEVGAGRKDLVDLVADPVWLALVQLCVAFCVFAWARGRRLGSVVDETRPVVADGAALNASAARLLDRNVDIGEIAEEVRASALRDLGVDPSAATIERLAAAAGLTPEEVHTALTRPVADDAELVVLARELSVLRARVRAGAELASHVGDFSGQDGSS